MTWDQVRHELDLPRLKSLNRYWKFSPPVHVMVAAYFGIKRPEKINNKNAAESLIALLTEQGAPNVGQQS